MSVNKVILIGNVGADPEMHYPEKDMAVAVVSLATNERQTSGMNITEWHRLVFFGEGARMAERYIRKGSKLFVEGKLRYRQYEDKFKISHKVAEIVVTSYEFLGRDNQ